jgi:dCTP diphosphatase
MNIDDLQRRLRQFADERDWERFHSPKNLSMALSVEAAELLEQFQWLTEAQSASPESVDREAAAAEIADIQIYLAMLADRLGIDIEEAVNRKIEANAVKYPPGSAAPAQR